MEKNYKELIDEIETLEGLKQKMIDRWEMALEVRAWDDVEYYENMIDLFSREIHRRALLARADIANRLLRANAPLKRLGIYLDADIF